MPKNGIPPNVIQPSPNSQARYPHPAKQRGRGLFGLLRPSTLGEGGEERAG